MAKEAGPRLTSDLTAVKKTKLHEQIVGQVQGLIEKGRLKHGDQLPPERALASIFKVSRHCVREAIRILEQRGILKSRPGSGTFIIQEDESSVVDFLARAIQREKNTLSEIFQFRELLEPQIAGLAARNATEKDIAALDGLVERQHSKIDNIKASKELDHNFHLALAQATGNAVLCEVVALFGHVLMKSRHEHTQGPDRTILSIEGHKRILAAIRKKDSGAARESMAAHLQTIRAFVMSSD